MSEKTDFVNDLLKFQDTFSRKRLAELITERYPGITESNINWKIHRLVKSGKISRCGRGLYTVNTKNDFVPVLSAAAEKFAAYFTNKFPLLEYCIWDTTILNNFLHHQIFSGSIILETEREYYESVFNMISGDFDNVFINPDRTEFYRYVIRKENPVIIIPLISQAPVRKVSGIKTLSIEKLLVDLLSDESHMDLFKETELVTIYRKILEKLNVNHSTLIRYASRRNLQHKLNKLLNFINKNKTLIQRKGD